MVHQLLAKCKTSSKNNSLSGAFFALVMLLGLTLSAHAWATKLLVVTEQWRPYNYTNEQGEIVGRATKKIKEILEQAGIDYEIKMYPWVRAMKVAQSRPNTLIYSIYRNPEREALFEWACPLIRPVGVYFFKLEERDDIAINTIEDAKRYVTAVVKGDSYYEHFTANGLLPGVHLDVSAQPAQFAKLLVAKRVDLLAGTEYTMSETMKAAGFDYDMVTPIYEIKKITKQRACAAFNLNSNPSVINKFRRALEEHNKKFVGP